MRKENQRAVTTVAMLWPGESESAAVAWASTSLRCEAETVCAIIVVVVVGNGGGTIVTVRRDRHGEQ